MQTPPATKTGRPPGEAPRTVRQGKGKLLSANISAELHAALEAEALKTGRSISQTAERWMESHAQLNDLLLRYTALIGPIQKLVRLARVVDEGISDRSLANNVMQSIWRGIGREIVLFKEPPDKLIAEARLIDDAWQACDAVVTMLTSAGDDNPSNAFARKPFEGGRSIGNILARPQGTSTPSPDRTVVRALEALRNFGKFARKEIEVALPLATACAETLERDVSARNRGLELAKALLRDGAAPIEEQTERTQ